MASIQAHKEDAIVSCISATISRIGSGISARIDNLSPPSVVSVIDSVKNHLNVKCSIVCTLTEVTDYLRVTPKDIQWITDDMGVFFDVESNVDWIIVTS